MMRYFLCIMLGILPFLMVTEVLAKQEGGSVKEGYYTMSYTVYIPDGVHVSALPVVYMFHGYGESGRSALRDYGWQQLADREGFVVVAPDIGHFARRVPTRNNHAMNLLKKVHQNIVAKYRVDMHKAYIAGMSMGGVLAYQAACEQPFSIAAVAVVSASMEHYADCQSRQMLPVLHIQSGNDVLVPTAGGMGQQEAYYWKSTEDVLNFWKQRNRCRDQKQQKDKGKDHLCSAYVGCQKSVEFCVVQGGHQWSGAVTGKMESLQRFGVRSPEEGVMLHHLQQQAQSSLKATSYIWNFFRKQGYW